MQCELQVCVALLCPSECLCLCPYKQCPFNESGFVDCLLTNSFTCVFDGYCATNTPYRVAKTHKMP